MQAQKSTRREPVDVSEGLFRRSKYIGGPENVSRADQPSVYEMRRAALLEAMRLNHALARSVIEAFPAMVHAAAGLLRAATYVLFALLDDPCARSARSARKKGHIGEASVRLLFVDNSQVRPKKSRACRPPFPSASFGHLSAMFWVGEELHEAGRNLDLF